MTSDNLNELNQVTKMIKENIDVDPDQDQTLENIRGQDIEDPIPDRIHHRREKTKTGKRRAIRGTLKKNLKKDMIHQSLIDPSIIARSQNMTKER